MTKPSKPYYPPVNVKAFTTYLSPQQSAKVARLAQRESALVTEQLGVNIKISMANMIRKMVDAYPEPGATPAPKPTPSTPKRTRTPRKPAPTPQEPITQVSIETAPPAPESIESMQDTTKSSALPAPTVARRRRKPRPEVS